MPLYEYQCTGCGEIEEAIQKFSDPPLTTCRHCSGRMNKLISQSSFHLKGTGWYVTDYSKKSSSTSGASAADTKTATGEKTETAGSDTSKNQSET